MKTIPNGPIPSQWFYDTKSRFMQCLQRRLILHWTVTSYNADPVSKASYHFLIDGQGRMIRGDRDPDERAPHTGDYNSALSISLCCMGGWNGKSTLYPPTQAQWDTLVKACAQLCELYEIPVTRATLLMHGEVEAVLGADQEGKWDIGYLPHLGIASYKAETCGDQLRMEVKHLLEGVPKPNQLLITGLSPAPDDKPVIHYRLQGSPKVFDGYLYDGSGYAQLRDFVKWMKDAGYDIKLSEVNMEHKTAYLTSSPPTYSVLELPLTIHKSGIGFAQVRPITDWMGLEISTEKWTKEKRILVIKKSGEES